MAFVSSSRLKPLQFRMFSGKPILISVSCRQQTPIFFDLKVSVTISFLFGNPGHKFQVPILIFDIINVICFFETAPSTNWGLECTFTLSCLNVALMPLRNELIPPQRWKVSNIHRVVLYSK